MENTVDAGLNYLSGSSPLPGRHALPRLDGCEPPRHTKGAFHNEGAFFDFGEYVGVNESPWQLPYIPHG